MTDSAIPSKGQLVPELATLCQKGYEIGRAESLRHTPGLLELTIAGGPQRPSSLKEWEERRTKLRAVLMEIAHEEVLNQLGQQYVEAAIKVFRLDKKSPVHKSEHQDLTPIQAKLDELFGGRRGGREFLLHHRKALFEVVAEALTARERKAQARADTAPPTPTSAAIDAAPAPAVTKPRKATPRAPRKPQVRAGPAKAKKAPPGRAKSTTPKSAPTQTAPSSEASATATPSSAPEQPKPSAVLSPPLQVGSPIDQSRPPRRIDWRRSARIAGAVFVLVLVAALGTVAILRSSHSGGHRSSTRQPPNRRPTQSQGGSVNPARRHALPGPPKFTAQVATWCFCGVGEGQIKVKPKIVNDSSRWLDLRTGSSARFGLAVYAPDSAKSWPSSIHPAYRRFGDWLFVPPNPPETGLSRSSFWTHWSTQTLRPHHRYFRSGEDEGDLVFNVDPTLVLRSGNVRLAYRVSRGGLYFPVDGRFSAWGPRSESGRDF